MHSVSSTTKASQSYVPVLTLSYTSCLNMAEPGRKSPSPGSKHQFKKDTGLLSPSDPPRSSSATSELQFPGIEALKVREPARPSKPLIRKPTENFIKDLLEFVSRGGKDNRSISNLFDEPSPDVGPCVLRDGDMIYSLASTLTAMIPDLPYESAFDKDEEDRDYFCRFDFGAGKNKKSVGTGTQPHYFLALGYLVEKNIKTGEIRSTYYVPCLDITDEPMSLWLVYDYPDSHEDADDAYRETYFGGIYDPWRQGPFFLVPDQLDKPSGAEQIDKTPAFPHGLFQSLVRFDFAQMSEDICRDWIGHAMEGLDPFKVNDCMLRTLKNYGGTLRAIETWSKLPLDEASN